MCKRLDSIAAVSAAADRLTEACETALHGAPTDPAQATHAGVGRAVRNAYRNLAVTPADMALQLRKMK
jgi:lysozyme family protein